MPCIMHLLMNKLRRMKMKYEKPELKKVEVNVKVNSMGSDRSSCEGGHCVKARYGQDH